MIMQAIPIAWGRYFIDPATFAAAIRRMSARRALSDGRSPVVPRRFSTSTAIEGAPARLSHNTPSHDPAGFVDGSDRGDHRHRNHHPPDREPHAGHSHGRTLKGQCVHFVCSALKITAKRPLYVAQVTLPRVAAESPRRIPDPGSEHITRILCPHLSATHNAMVAYPTLPRPSAAIRTSRSKPNSCGGGEAPPWPRRPARRSRPRRCPPRGRAPPVRVAPASVRGRGGASPGRGRRWPRSGGRGRSRRRGR